MNVPDTPWRNAGFDRPGSDRLLFGRMFEDWTIEASLFPPGARVFCIASAGCTALRLAALGHDVTAVDINGAQLALVRERIAGEQSREGAVDRMMARGGRAVRLLGWTDSTVLRSSTSKIRSSSGRSGAHASIPDAGRQRLPRC